MSTFSNDGKSRAARYVKAGLYSSTILMCLSHMPASAQSSRPAEAAEADSGEILVAARKIKETAQKVPVVMSVVTGDKLQELQITQISDLPALVPGLTIGHFQAVGAQVSLRGVGATAFANNVDQSVGLNIDGVQLGSGHAYKLGLFDLGQIEVLKGPQSLFYGKSTTGGVISLRTADPTDKFEMSAQAGYEAEARTWSTEGILSGPVGDTLKLRLAAHYEDSQGYFRNGTKTVAPNTGAVPLQHDRSARSDNVMVRGTAIWEPTSNFTARIKANYSHTVAINNLATQFKVCTGGTGGVPPLNTAFLGGANSCKLGRTTYVVGYDPAAFPGATTLGITIPENGQPFSHTDVAFGSLNLSYQPAANISVDSTTGYYWIRNRDWVNAANTTFAGPPVIAQSLAIRRGLTEEVRASSSFEGPLNFVTGAFYEDSSLVNNSLIFGQPRFNQGAILSYNKVPIDVRTYSVFGQIKFKIIPELELAAGVRYADEKRTQNPVQLPSGAAFLGQVKSIRSKKYMPDFTATYTPVDTLTLFGAYRKGFKSGAFGTAVNNVDNSFGDESAKGGEFGVKSRLFDRQLVLNVAAYRYKFSGLQVGIITPPVNGFSVSRVVNAGAAKTQGIDLDAALRPRAIPGLQLNASLNWNRGRFSELRNVPCWTGQTSLQGCDQNFNTVTGRFTAQNLSGTSLPRAPRVQSTVGGSYEIKTASDYTFVISSSANYSARYRTQLAAGVPNDGVYQKAYAKFDLGVTLKTPGDRWEVSLVANNINDKVIASSCTQLATQSGNVGGIVTGAAANGPSGTSQTACFPEPGRELWLRLIWRPFARR